MTKITVKKTVRLTGSLYRQIEAHYQNIIMHQKAIDAEITEVWRAIDAAHPEYVSETKALDVEHIANDLIFFSVLDVGEEPAVIH